MDAEQRARLEKLVVPTWPLVTVNRGDLLALLTAYDEAVARIAEVHVLAARYCAEMELGLRESDK